jgi:hypothetical protein
VAFLDITQASDKVWQPGLLFKIRKIFPHAYYRILESYLKDRHFQVKFKDEITTLRITEAGIPQRVTRVVDKDEFNRVEKWHR